jgi:hypothetical protein
MPVEQAAARPKAARPASLGVSATLRSMADRAMAADPAVAALLGGTKYTVVKEGPWTRVQSAEQIGVVRVLKLAKPVTTEMRPWPVIVWDKAADTYRTAQYNASYVKVSTLTVFITGEGRIVQLSPGPESSVVEGSGNEWAKAYPGGSD